MRDDSTGLPVPLLCHPAGDTGPPVHTVTSGPAAPRLPHDPTPRHTSNFCETFRPTFFIVIPGLDPGIRISTTPKLHEAGLPGQARQ